MGLILQCSAHFIRDIFEADFGLAGFEIKVHIITVQLNLYNSITSENFWLFFIQISPHLNIN